MFLVMVLCMSLLAGCLNRSTEQTAMNHDPNDDKVTLTFMGWEASPLETESVQRGLDNFMQDHPHIDVVYTPVPNEQYHSKLLTMMAGSTAPDVFFIGSEQYRDFQSRDVLMNLTELFGQDFSLDDFIPSSQDIMTIDDQIYGISSTTVSPVLFYNKDIFDAADVPYPPHDPQDAWTWAEFVDVAQQLTFTEGSQTEQYGVYGLEAFYMHVGLILSNGGQVWDDQKNIVLNSPASQDVLTAIKALREEHGVSPEARYLENVGMNAAQMLQTGKIAMMVDGSWALQELAQMGFPVGVAPLPKFGGQATTHGQAHLNAAWSETEHPEEAWALIKYLSSESYQLDLIREGLWMPNRTNMYTQEWIDQWHNPDVHPEGFVAMTSFFKDSKPFPFALNDKAAINDIITEELDKFFYGQQSVEDTLQAIEQRGQAELGK